MGRSNGSGPFFNLRDRTMQIKPLRSYRCYHYPQDTNGLPATSDTGVLPFIQVRAASAEHALRAAAALTNRVIDRAERLDDVAEAA